VEPKKDNESTGSNNMKKLKRTDLSKKLPRHPTRKYPTRKLSDIKGIVVHCTDNYWDVWELARRDITPGKTNPVSSRGCPECTYHSFITKEGKIYRTVDYTKSSWHAAGYNAKTVSTCIQYLATGNKEAPPKVQMEALYNHLADEAVTLKIVPDKLLIRGHRELKGTGYLIDRGGHKRLKKTCPGLLVDLDALRLEVAKRMQKILKSRGLYKGEIDGLFGPRSKVALANA
jgi:hypothetical protein